MDDIRSQAAPTLERIATATAVKEEYRLELAADVQLGDDEPPTVRLSDVTEQILLFDKGSTVKTNFVLSGD